MARSNDGELAEAVKSGNPRKALEAIRDYLVHELEGNRCSTCNMSKLRTGDTAALVLRLQKVLEEIQAIPEETGTASPLEQLKKRMGNVTPLDAGKNGKRQQGGRHPNQSRSG